MTAKLNRKLIVKSKTENLSIVRDFVKESANILSIPDNLISQLILAVDEACTNIIKHAYKNSPLEDIFITIEADSSKISISIRDSGISFNPNNIPEPNLQQFHKEKRGGGLGMFLMKKLMDDVHYNISANSNEVVLVKYF